MIFFKKTRKYIIFASLLLFYSILVLASERKCVYNPKTKICITLNALAYPSNYLYEGVRSIKTLFSERNISGLIARDQKITKRRFSDLNSGFNFYYDKGSMKNAGYLLLSNPNPNQNGLPNIELWDLNYQRLIHKYDFNPLEILKKTGNSRNKKTIRFIHPLLLEDGSLVVHSSHTNADPGILFKFDKCGNYISHNQSYGYHHSLEIDKKGDLYIPIANVPLEINKSEYPYRFRNEGFAVLSKDLEVKKIYSLLNIFSEGGLANEIYSESQLSDDPLHLNDVHPLILENKTEMVFLSLRHQAAIIGYNLTSNKLSWIIKGATGLQHDVTPLDKYGKSISIFDNNSRNTRGKHLGNKLLEISNLETDDSLSKFYLGEFLEDQNLIKKEYNFSLMNQNLRPITQTEGLASLIYKNNSIFVEETNYGRLFEIDKSNGKLLWQYLNKGYNGKIYMMSWSRRLDSLPSNLNVNFYSECTK